MSPVSLFILEIIVASAMAGETTTQQIFGNVSVTNSSFTTNKPFYETNSTNITSLPTTTFSLDITGHTSNTTTPKHSGNWNFTDLMTPGSSKSNSKDDNIPPNTPTPPPKKIEVTTQKTHHSKPTPASSTGGDKTGVIILIVIIVLFLAFGITCFVLRRRERRYSIDLTSRVDEASIPLSAVQPEASPMPQNGIQTSESIEMTAKEPEKPEVKPETQQEQKAEADKPADPSSESEAPASAPAPASPPAPAPSPAPDSSDDKPKADVVEQSSLAPAEPNAEEKTDDEGEVSNKTSVESLKETNENNSNNNTDSGQKRDMYTLWEVRVDSLV